MRIKSQTTFMAGMLLVLGVVMIAMPVGMIRGFSADGPVPGGVWFVAAIFAPLGFIVAYLAARQLVQRVRFGGWEVECPDGGGRLGQPLVVALVPPQVVTPTGEVECQLTCIKSRPVGSSNRRAVARGSDRLFETSWSVPPVSFDPQIGLPITLPLPELGLASTRGRKGNVEWKLSVKIRRRTTHEMEFEIPVHAGKAKPPGSAESIEEEAERRTRAEQYRQAQSAPATAAPGPSTTTWVAPSCVPRLMMSRSHNARQILLQRRYSMLILTFAVTCALAFLPSAAIAQTRPIDKGVSLAPSALAVPVDGPDSTLSGNHSATTQRRKDPLWNGVIIGAGLGALAGTLVSFAVIDCSECAGFNVPLTFGVLGVGAGAGIGAGIDAWRQTRSTVTTTPHRTRRLTVSPFLGKDAQGLIATIRF